MDFGVLIDAPAPALGDRPAGTDSNVPAAYDPYPDIDEASAEHKAVAPPARGGDGDGAGSDEAALADLYGPTLRSVPLLTKEEEQTLGRSIRDSRLTMTAALAEVPAAVAVLVEFMRQAEAKERPVIDALFAPFHEVTGLESDPDETEQGALSWRQAAAVAEDTLSQFRRLQRERAAGDTLTVLRRQLADTMCRIEPGIPALGEALRRCEALDKRVSRVEKVVGAFHADIMATGGNLSKTCDDTHKAAWHQAYEELRQVETEAGIDLTILREACHRSSAAHAAYYKARERMVTANLRLVFFLAHRAQGHGVALEDLIQEAMIGLMRAVDKFDYRVGTKFSTYAVRWIRQATARVIADASRTVRVAAHMHDNMVRLRRKASALAQTLGREPTVAELGEASELPDAKVREAVRLSYQPLSLDAPVAAVEDSPLVSMIADANAESPSENAHNEELARAIKRFLDKLPPREAFIMRLRHGIGETEPRSLEDIGQILGITRERTRQLEARASGRLREMISEDLLEVIAS